MKERPILFSAPMVRAILEGRKTQTRRLVKPWTHGGVRVPLPIADDGPRWRFNGAALERPDAGGVSFVPLAPSPYGTAGDRLWVRETFCVVNDAELGGSRWVDYRATPRYGESSHPAGWDNAPDDPEALRWKPAIHMPRWASRLLLEVTAVRVERLQDISERDAIAEGARRFDDIPDPHPYKQGARWSMEQPTTTEDCLGTPRFAFANLWDKVNGKRAPWSSNPWVWVVEFRRVEAAAEAA